MKNESTYPNAHIFESPGLYKYNLVMCRKLLRSVDQPVPHEHILLTSSPCCCLEN